MYQLYSNPRLPYSNRVHIYLLFRNLPYETIPVALEKLENKKNLSSKSIPMEKFLFCMTKDFIWRNHRQSSIWISGNSIGTVSQSNRTHGDQTSNSGRKLTKRVLGEKSVVSALND